MTAAFSRLSTEEIDLGAAHDMDVAYSIRSSWPILLAACLSLSWGGQALSAPMYTAIDLGTGSPTFGVDSSGNGTVTGSNGLTYTFNPVQNHLPAQWMNTSQGVPIVEPAPAYGAYQPFSTSTFYFMNSQGLAAGVNWYSLAGHQTNSTAFITQQQPDGSWGPPTPIWSGAETSTAMGGFGPSQMSILGVSPGGQVLGIGASDPYGTQSFDALYLYDANTHTLTSITSVVNSMKATSSPQVPYWILDGGGGQLDDQGRILVRAIGDYYGPSRNLLLVPEGLSPAPIPAPEPATWAIFAALIGGWLARKRLRLVVRRD
jgi:hypothetical protein